MPTPPATAVPTVTLSAAELPGRWGLASYRVETDRTRTESEAKNACGNPYKIEAGANGGVMMHLADQSTPSELALKGAPGGKTYIGPREEPPGSPQDRLVEHFDGRILITRWIDPEVQGRYGTMVYVRCGAEGTKKKPAARAKPKPAAAKPAAKPPA